MSSIRVKDNEGLQFLNLYKLGTFPHPYIIILTSSPCIITLHHHSPKIQMDTPPGPDDIHMSPTEKLHYGVVALKSFLGHIDNAGEELFSGFATVISRIEDDQMKKLVIFMRNQLMEKYNTILEEMKATVDRVDGAAVDTLLQVETQKFLGGSFTDAALEYKQMLEEKDRLVSLLEKENEDLKHKLGEEKSLVVTLLEKENDSLKQKLSQIEAEFKALKVTGEAGENKEEEGAAARGKKEEEGAASGGKKEEEGAAAGGKKEEEGAASGEKKGK